MNFFKLPILAPIVLALSLNAFAQDSSDDEWVSSESSQVSDGTEAAPAYDGSNDSEFANDEEYASAYARYKTETTKKSDINRQRNEGFSRTVLLGVRGQGGINTFYGDGSDGWGMGVQGGAGLLLKMNLGIKNLSLVPELTFNYRRYNFEKDMGVYTNEAQIDIYMFEIPLMVRYTFEDYNLFVAGGVNLGLKLKGTSEFSSSGGTRYNTVATSGMEVGGLLDFGYMLTRFVHIDLRVVACFTSLLNDALVAEELFYDSKLNTFYTTFGVSFLF